MWFELVNALSPIKGTQRIPEVFFSKGLNQKILELVPWKQDEPM